jgi:hypothetical protein
MLLGPRHDVLNLPQLPRDKTTLQTIIADARAQRRKSRLMRFASCNLAAWAIFILMVWTPMHAPHASAPPAPSHQQHQQPAGAPRSSLRPS